jgi:Copper amine oxidase N-terminal domain
LKRLSTGVLAAIVAVGFGLTSVSAAQTVVANGNIGTLATPATVAQAMMMPPADFGTPPSGEVPILFNDHHVYSKPDRLKQNRVLAALVRGNEILVPLRSMFEQMGATVSYDPASKTADVSKPGSDVKVTVGKPEVVINGESRPLDVPPEIYKGAIVVPVRVISEGMGAYVQWVPEKKLVVVRYVAAPVPTPPPTAPPTPPPTPKPTPPPPPPTPTPTPAPTAKPVNYEHFIVGDYVFHPKVYNEFSNGIVGNNNSFAARGAIEFPAFGLPWMLEGDYRSYQYQHNGSFPAGTSAASVPGDPGNVTVIGGSGQVYVPGFRATDTDIDGRFALKVADPRLYVGVGYLSRSENYGYPRQGGVGFGVEKLPDLDQPFSVYGSVWYYPDVSASFTSASANGQFSYRALKYEVGGTYVLGSFSGIGIFIDGGYLGDSYRSKSLAPSDSTHNGPYVGLGLKF